MKKLLLVAGIIALVALMARCTAVPGDDGWKIRQSPVSGKCYEFYWNNWAAEVSCSHLP